jgi:3-hydroxyacyl-[acyl-carrier-protein] dehydratase
MHWYWIDRITAFESRKRAEAIKAITLGEDHLHDHFQFYPVMPASLVVEGLAQTAGMLVSESNGYRTKVVLAKITQIIFHEMEFVPGDTLVYEALLEALRDDGAVVSVSVRKKGKLVAEGNLVFAHLGNSAVSGSSFSDKMLFEDGDLLKMMKVFRAYEVAVDENGNALKMPDMAISE